MGKSDSELTDVIFRKYPDGGDIIAIFPAQLGTYDAYTCGSYQHVGQHGACEPMGVIRGTDPATPSEYKALAAELTQLGYKLRVVKRYSSRYLRIRQSELKQLERD